MPQPQTQTEPTRFLKLLIALTHFYFVGLFSWALLHWIFGDRWWWLFLLNAFADYLFFPLFIVLALILITHRRDLIIGFVISLALGFLLFGHLLMPPIFANHNSKPQITVMTSNILGFNMGVEGVIDAIIESEADIVAIQELNPQTAEAIQQDLDKIYPYQELLPESGVTGMGIISRFPMRSIEVEFDGYWVGTPQVMEVIWEGEKVMVINLHAIPPSIRSAEHIKFTVKEREQQLSGVVEFIESRKEPVLLLGDLNVSEKNTAHKIMENALEDAWIKGGWGLGHTFPGAASPGSSRPSIGRFLSPKWLLRLDYIFYSEHWEVEKAWIGPWDSGSDHRPVMAKLILEQ